MFTSPDTIQISDILRLPRFEFHTSVGEVDKIPVKLVGYGILPDGEYVRDRGKYFVAVLYGASGQVIAEGVDAELLDPTK